MTEDHLFLVL